MQIPNIIKEGKHMKFFLILLLPLSLFSQVDYPDSTLGGQDQTSFSLKGKKEFSVAFSYQSMKEKGDQEASWFYTLPLSYIYYLSENIGLGAELILTDAKDFDPEDENFGIILSAILEANFPLAQKSAIPFLLAGYGFSNGSMLFDRLAFHRYKDTTLGVLNIGAGIKFRFNESVFSRIEFRYLNFNGDYNTREIDVSYTNILFGFSVLI